MQGRAYPFTRLVGRHSVFGGVDAIMKPYAQEFYSSKAWKETRKAYAQSKRNLCEICLAKGLIKPGVIVHHKVHIEPENIGDPTVTLNWNNLQLVCRDCHAEIHDRRQRRYKLDELGRVVFPDSPL